MIRRRRSRRVGVIAAVAALLLLVGLVPAADATWGPWGRGEQVAPDASLAVSESADRADAQVLDGAILSADGEYAIFVDPVDTEARGAVFYLNGRFAKFERYAPFDLRGTKRDGTTVLLPGEHLRAGENTVAVTLFGRRGGRSNISATFTVVDPEPLPTIAEVATGDENFSTLVAALSAASASGPVDFLGAVSDPEADLTVFAPTNDAFAKLGSAVDDALADPSGLLTEILSLHVVAGGQTGAELVEAGTVTTLGGGEVTVSLVDGEVFVNDAKVVVADIEAANGIVHVIDTVLLPTADPEPLPTIAEVATGDENFSTLVTALTAASEAGEIDFLAAVSDPEADLTVFAPTNDAFAALDPGTLDAVLADPAGLLTDILAYHVLAGGQTSGPLLESGAATTLQGGDVTIQARDGKVFINDSQVVVADIETANGVVHVIDAVLIP